MLVYEISVFKIVQFLVIELSVVVAKILESQIFFEI